MAVSIEFEIGELSNDRDYIFKFKYFGVCAYLVDISFYIIIIFYALRPSRAYWVLLLLDLRETLWGIKPIVLCVLLDTCHTRCLNVQRGCIRNLNPYIKAARPV